MASRVESNVVSSSGRRTIATEVLVGNGHVEVVAFGARLGLSTNHLRAQARHQRRSCYAARVTPRIAGCVVSVLLLTLGLDVSSTPVRVRARSDMEAHVLRSDQGLALRGRLADDAGLAIVGGPVHARIQGLEARVVRTGQDGGFELTISGSDATALAEVHGDRLTWALAFAGGPNFGPSEASGAIELRRMPTQLVVQLDRSETTLDEGPVTVEVAVKSGGKPVGSVPIHLRVGQGPELVGDADSQGRIAFLVRPSTIRRLGRVEVEARFAGDVTHSSASGKVTLIVARATRLTLRVGREGDSTSGRYRFSGRLSGEQGALAGRMVAIVCRSSDDGGGDAQTQRAVLTDTNGVFLVAIEAREFQMFGGEAVEAQAVFEPPELSLQVARSERALIPVPGLPRVPWSWYLACLVSAGGLVLFAVAIHRRFWEYLWRLRRRRRLRRHLPGEALELLSEGDTHLPFVTTRPDWLAGVVVERESGRPLHDIVVTVRQGGEVHEVAGDREGRFALGPLAKGSWRLSVVGPGLLSVTAELLLPHAGELDRMTVRMESIRARVRDAFLGRLTPAKPGGGWGFETPATLATRDAQANPEQTEAIDGLKQIVERVWFEPGMETLDDVRIAEKLGGTTQGDS
jgi:hypothetical protein